MSDVVVVSRDVNATGESRLLHTNRAKGGAICPALRASNTVPWRAGPHV